MVMRKLIDFSTAFLIRSKDFLDFEAAGSHDMEATEKVPLIFIETGMHKNPITQRRCVFLSSLAIQIDRVTGQEVVIILAVVFICFECTCF